MRNTAESVARAQAAHAFDEEVGVLAEPDCTCRAIERLQETMAAYSQAHGGTDCLMSSMGPSHLEDCPVAEYGREITRRVMEALPPRETKKRSLLQRLLARS